MKIITSFLFAAIMFVSAFGQSDYVLTVKQGKIEKKDTQTLLPVTATLANNTDDTLKYLSMSCSWIDFYSLDNNKISFEYWGCTKNGPVVIIIAPHESKSTELKLIVSQTTEGSEITFKIGLDLLKVKNEKELLDLCEEYFHGKLKKNIIWSNPVTIKR